MRHGLGKITIDGKVIEAHWHNNEIVKETKEDRKQEDL